jgi:TrpR-related protein YerC/YecD
MSQRHENIKKLYQAILALNTIEEVDAFLDDVCTKKEVEDMAIRLEVARLLLDGHTYEQIEYMTKISSATISRVNRCIQYGPQGYQTVLDRMK